MSKRKRGLSHEEKRETLLKIFFESGEPYDLKEMEKVGSKAGVVTQTIKDVLQSLVDDGMVELEKVGAKNFYWAFPSKAFRQLKTKVEQLEKAIAADTARAEELRSKVESMAAASSDAEEREAKLERLRALREERAEVDKQLALHSDSDPEVLRELERKMALAKACANRWTDNTWSVKDLCVGKFNMDAAAFDKLMGMHADFDYLP